MAPLNEKSQRSAVFPEPVAQVGVSKGDPGPVVSLDLDFPKVPRSCQKHSSV